MIIRVLANASLELRASVCRLGRRRAALGVASRSASRPVRDAGGAAATRRLVTGAAH
jgi:hypothetical protein